jgi:hypothetical protein
MPSRVNSRQVFVSSSLARRGLGAGMTMGSDVIDPLAILGSAALAIWLLAFIVLIVYV